MRQLVGQSTGLYKQNFLIFCYHSSPPFPADKGHGPLTNDLLNEIHLLV